jgi:hypothetical protein
MISPNCVTSNENLLKVICTYLDVKDLSIVNSVSKPLNKVSKGFNNYWRNKCIDTFSTDYEHYR